MTKKAKRIYDGYKDPKRTFHVELLQIKMQVKGSGRVYSEDAVLKLLDNLIEDYTELVL